MSIWCFRPCTVAVALGALLALCCWLGTWPEFDSVYVPQRRRYLQEPPLADLLKAVQTSGRLCVKPTRVVVTLSTFEGRLGNLKTALASLVHQSCPPDAIYIFASRNPRTKVQMEERSKSTGDGVISSDAFWDDVKSTSSTVIVKEIEEDWGPATKLLAALQMETDPSTWLITVDDDTQYNRDMVLALTVAATHLPTHMAPAFWCEQAWADGYRSVKQRTLEASEDGTVHGWCGGFAGVLFKRFMFDDQVFNFSAAPAGCLAHDDVWWGGHLLSAGYSPYLINPGFFSVEWSPTAGSERQDHSVHVLDAKAKGEGFDLQGDCASWFAALRGVHFDGDEIPAGVFRHREATAQAGQDLWVLSKWFSSGQGVLPAKGAFVEFGALDGKIHSNTNFFEAHLNWHGALAEPSEHFGPKLALNRKRSLGLQGAVCGKTGVRNFVDTPWPGLSGFEDTYEPSFLADMKAGRLWFNITSITPIQCFSLQDLLDKASLRRVDYMTVDTEGSEYETLSAFPFDEYQVGLIQVEVHMYNCVVMRKRWWSRTDSWMHMCSQRGAAEKLIQLMVGNGYALAEMFVVGLGGKSRSSMHQLWSPVHITGEMTIDFIFRKQLGDPSGRPRNAFNDDL